MDRSKLLFTKPSGEFRTADNRYVPVEAISLLPKQTFAAGITKGSTWDTNGSSDVRLTCAVTAKSGTNPTLDVTVQTSHDGDVWRTLGTFVQKTDALFAMGGVTSTGTTPPAITLTGTPVRPIDLKVIVGTAGARGTGTVRISVDGGVTYSDAVVTAATLTVYDEYGADTGLVLNYANASSNADNVWTAKCVAWERKVFSGVDRYLRAVASVGGTDTPTFEAAVTGALVF